MDWSSELRGFLDGLVEFVWPGPCALCGSDLPACACGGVCPACWAGLPARSGPGCPRCDLPAPWCAATCPDCGARDRSPLEATVTALLYVDSVVVLHRRLKFDGAAPLAGPFSQLMAAAWRARRPFPVDIVARVPADPLRWSPRRRTPSLLGRRVARRLGLPWDGRALRKIRPTPPLTRRGREARQHALDGAFRARRGSVAGRRVLVVDDIVTTGATIHEAARALVAAGATRVAALALARTPLSPVFCP